MCGIATILRNNGVEITGDTVYRMVRDVSHRGPDHEGLAFLHRREDGCDLSDVGPDGCWDVALAYRRLSILDLSSAASQPMAYQGRYWIVYNGEVYNYIELRSQLQKLGHTFRSNSDTEVVLASYAEWGTDCFSRFRGMWGLVIIDGLRNEAILSRDRLGIKPLYIWRGSGMTAIASEIKQFKHIPGYTARLDTPMAVQYLQTGYEYPDRTFFEGIQPFAAGTWSILSLNTLEPGPMEPYWHPDQVQVSVTQPEEAGRLFADKLEESVHIHLRSDVPVGCALSGGLDSSSIAVLVNKVQEPHHGSLHTFTSCFPGDNIDEGKYVQELLRYLPAESHVVSPDPDTFLNDLDHFIWVHDEPVGSLSVYAGYCVSRLTSQAGVPVTLNGQGGDETIGGYWQSYFVFLHDLARRWEVKSLISHLGGALFFNGNPHLIGQIPAMYRRYRARMSRMPQISFPTLEDGQAPSILDGFLALDGQAQRIHQIREMFLPRLLKWEDRNSMAFSVEGRYPFLDHELIELCLSFSPRTLYSRGWTKWPLRQGLKDVLPPQIRSRRSKTGFEVPQNAWLCGSLRPVLERWLLADRPLWQIVDRAEVSQVAHQTWAGRSPKEELGQSLFRLFIFDQWAERAGVK